MEIIPVKDSIPILPERHCYRWESLALCGDILICNKQKAHNASNTWEDFCNLCKTYPVVVYHIKIDIICCRQLEQILLLLSILFEMWCWRRMEKISWTDHVRNEEVLLRVNEQRNILHEIRKRRANWIGHTLRRNCLLKQVIDGKIKGEMEVTRRHKKLLDDRKDKRGYSYLKEEALDRTLWRHRFGGGFGPVVRQNTEWMNEMH